MQTNSQKKSASCSEISRGSRSMAASRMTSRSSHRSESLIAAGTTKRAAMALSLTKKKVSFCAVNFVGWLAKVTSWNDQKIISLHAAALEELLECFMPLKGIPDTFAGDRMLCSFNASKPLGTHRVAAASGLCMAREALKKHDLTLSGAVVTGEARVGNMGCEIMKKFSFMTPVLTWCYALERMARKLEIPTASDMFLAEEVKTDFLLRLVWSAVFKKRTPKPIKVYELFEKKPEQENDEWMYQLEEAEAADPWNSWNKWALLVLEAPGAPEVRMQMQKALEADGQSIHAKRLQEAVEAGVFTPTEVDY